MCVYLPVYAIFRTLGDVELWLNNIIVIVTTIIDIFIIMRMMMIYADRTFLWVEFLLHGKNHKKHDYMRKFTKKNTGTVLYPHIRYFLRAKIMVLWY